MSSTTTHHHGSTHVFTNGSGSDIISLKAGKGESLNIEATLVFDGTLEADAILIDTFDKVSENTGSIQITTGDSTNNNSGNFNIQTGLTVAGSSGTINLETGNSSTGNTGDILIKSGDATQLNGGSGGITLETGSIIGGSGTRAPITLNSPTTSVVGQLVVANGILSTSPDTNIAGRLTYPTQGYIGEVISYTVPLDTTLTSSAYGNFATNIVSPALDAGLWLITLSGTCVLTGSIGNTANYKLILRNSSGILSDIYATDTDSIEIIASTQAYSPLSFSVPCVVSDTGSTFRIQGRQTGTNLLVKKGTQLNCIRYA